MGREIINSMKKIKCNKFSRITLIFLLFLLLIVPSLYAADDDFIKWLAEFRIEALSKGISARTFDTAFTGVKPVERVIELDRNQPEFKLTFEKYMKKVVTKRRLKRGRRLLAEHREVLEKVEQQYGVQPHFLVAIWAIESNFGDHRGGFPVINALTTLAYDARRGKFFRNELLSALRILDEGHIELSEMRGSWAGAMGQVQFIPSSFVSFAVDFDGDGRKDIWHSLPDIFASAANYLSSYNWQNDLTWGRQVLLPEGFDHKLAGLDVQKRLSEWQEMGVRRPNGTDLPRVDVNASLVLPSGNGGPAFLVYDNYRAIYKWNRSHFYVIAVGTLADRIAALDRSES
jgi:membrane-bound lytic murein transglycosylase B